MDVSHVSARPLQKSRSLTILRFVSLSVVTKYIPGVLWGWDLGWFFSSWGWHGAIALSNWGWSIQFTPAFTAVGFLTGPNAAFSWL